MPSPPILLPDGTETHFREHELECHGEVCCGHACPMDSHFMRALEDLRMLVATPLHPNSGFRCPVYNPEVSRSKRSQHTFGRAADLPPPSHMSIDNFHSAITLVPAFTKGGIIVHDTFIHLDTRPNGPFFKDKRK